MKKYLILFLVAGLFSLSACSDDEVNNEPDPILGSWVLVEISPSTPLFDPQACDSQSAVEFQEDGTANSTFYIAADKCSAQNASGNWKNHGNNVYSMTVPVLGTLQGTVEFMNGRFDFTTDVLGNATTLTFELSAVLFD